jgi:hypothetical protein
MITWFRKLKQDIGTVRFVIESYRANIDALQSQINDLRTIIRANIDIHADVSMTNRAPSTVIVIGKFRNHDVVQTYSIQTGELKEIIEHLRSLERYGTVRSVDAMPGFKGIAEHELGHKIK